MASAGCVPLHVPEVANFFISAVSLLVRGAELQLEFWNWQGSPAAWAPAALQGPLESDVSLWEAFQMDFLELTTPWTSPWGSGTSVSGPAVLRFQLAENKQHDDKHQNA